MSSDVEPHASQKLESTPLEFFPYPHIYVRDIFPADFYGQLQTMLPKPEDMRSIEEIRPVRGYKERFVLELGSKQLAALPQGKQQFWTGLRKSLISGAFTNAILRKFNQQLQERFGPQVDLYTEALLVQDITNYNLGPHTDAPRKVITLLFYLPKDDTQKHLGTSLYVPKDGALRSAGGPPEPRDKFDVVKTMPFMPNSLFAFAKSDRSFHGVEPIADENCRRWLLLYDFYVRQKA
jgi:hypothetical protein